MTKTDTPQSIQAILDAGKAKIIKLCQDPKILDHARVVCGRRMVEELNNYSQRDLYELVMDGMQGINTWTAEDIVSEWLDITASDDDDAKEMVDMALADLDLEEEIEGDEPDED